MLNEGSYIMSTYKEITLEITNHCQMDCIYCSSESTVWEYYNNISIDKIKSLIKEINKIGIKNINLSGGESFNHPNIFEIINEIIKKNINLTIYTSGCTDIFLDKYIDRNINLVFHYLPNVASGFNTTRDMILKALYYGYNVEVHIVPCKINMINMSKKIKNLQIMGVDQIRLLNLVYQGRALKNKNKLEYDIEDLRIELAKLDSLENIKVGLGLQRKLGWKLTRECECLKHEKLVIKVNGDVIPCEIFKDCLMYDKILMGNIYKDNLIKIIKNKKNCQEYCRKM